MGRQRRDPEELGLAFARVTGREYIMSGAVTETSCYGRQLHGAMDWEEGNGKGLYSMGHRNYQFAKVEPGDVIIFWSRKNKGIVCRIQDVRSSYDEHYLSWYEGDQDDVRIRVGDLYSILR